MSLWAGWIALIVLGSPKSNRRRRMAVKNRI